MPRKMSIPFDNIEEAINVCKNTIFEGHKMIVGPTHPIWADTRQRLNREISEKSLYTIVKCNRNDVLNKIHIKPGDNVNNMMMNDSKMTLMDNDSSDFEIETSSDNDIDTINFKITLSKEEWAKIYCEKKSQLNNSRYLNRNYKMLYPGVWTEIIHSHFWEQTKIAYTIIYKRAKIYESGLQYCVFYGKCRSCNSELKG